VPSPRVFAREFSKGLVIVRPPDGEDFDSGALSLQLAKPLKPLRSDGTREASVTAVSLRKGEAAILLNP
jgi:hypothetical protein